MISWVFYPHNDIQIWQIKLRTLESLAQEPDKTLPLLSPWAPRPLSQSPHLSGGAFADTFPAGAAAPVYLPCVRPLNPSLPPQQLRHFCIHRLVDPENTRPLAAAQLTFHFVFLFLAELGLRCCARAFHRGGFSRWGAQGLSPGLENTGSTAVLPTA